MKKERIISRAYPILFLAQATAHAARQQHPCFQAAPLRAVQARASAPSLLPGACLSAFSGRGALARPPSRASKTCVAFCTASADDGSVKENLDAVNSAISDVCKQLGKPVPRLVAVSKVQPNDKVTAAYEAGQRHFGENYVQELVGKAPLMPADIKWHFIGALQSNKAKTLVQGVKSLWMVESVHNIKCAGALNKACAAAGRSEKLKVLVQVNTSNEDAKSGCEPNEVVELATYISKECDSLQLAGLMTIGAFGDPNPEPYFKLLTECRTQVSEALGVQEEDLELSMGMSGDFDKAIAAGSTNVRVGSTIFGARPQKA